MAEAQADLACHTAEDFHIRSVRRYPAKVVLTLLVPGTCTASDSQPVEITTLNCAVGAGSSLMFPGTLSRSAVTAELAEQRTGAYSLTAQTNGTSCATDSVLTVLRMLGAGRNACDLTLHLDDQHYLTRALQQTLALPWSQLGSSRLKLQRDRLQWAVDGALGAPDAGLASSYPPGYHNPRDVWRTLTQALPSVSFTLYNTSRCTQCKAESRGDEIPLTQTTSILDFPLRLLQLHEFRELTWSQPASIIGDKVRLCFGRHILPSEACVNCGCTHIETSTYVADRLPYILALGDVFNHDGRDADCRCYQPDIEVAYRRLSSSAREGIQFDATYRLSAMMHVGGEGFGTHITASVRVNENTWAMYDGLRGGNTTLVTEQELFGNVGRCTMPVYIKLGDNPRI